MKQLSLGVIYSGIAVILVCSPILLRGLKVESGALGGVEEWRAVASMQLGTKWLNKLERTDVEVDTGKIKQMDLVTGTLNVIQNLYFSVYL